MSFKLLTRAKCSLGMLKKKSVVNTLCSWVHTDGPWNPIKVLRVPHFSHEKYLLSSNNKIYLLHQPNSVVSTAPMNGERGVVCGFQSCKIYVSEGNGNLRCNMSVSFLSNKTYRYVASWLGGTVYNIIITIMTWSHTHTHTRSHTHRHTHTQSIFSSAHAVILPCTK